MSSRQSGRKAPRSRPVAKKLSHKRISDVNGIEAKSGPREFYITLAPATPRKEVVVLVVYSFFSRRTNFKTRGRNEDRQRNGNLRTFLCARVLGIMR